MHDLVTDNEAASNGDRRREPRIDRAQRAHRDAIYRLARAADLHDEDTGLHIVRIGKIVECLAIALGFAASDAHDLGLDAVLHDVGKLTIPHAILQKPARFTHEERQIMESHTILGERLLSTRPSMARAARIARSHHECWDGSGYPDGLRGEEIPIGARITAVADILDALVSDRCYKESQLYADAVVQVWELSGTHLDPTVVAALRRCDANGDLATIFRPSAYLTADGSIAVRPRNSASESIGPSDAA